METVEFIESQTKRCSFCAETIQAAAIKCRFCGEFLDSDKAKAIESWKNPDSGSRVGQQSEHILFEGRPSLWAMAGAIVRGLVFLGIAGLLMYYRLENLSMFQFNEDLVSTNYGESVAGPPTPELAENVPQELSGFGLTEEQKLVFGRYRVIAGIGLAIVVLLTLAMKMVKLKMTHYEVTADRIEWSRGILNRRVDNLDMFRVIDLKLRRSLPDCILGIGTVGLITNDKTDPEFTFEKIRNSRKLYDIIKTASLDADQKRSVVHLE